MATIVFIAIAAILFDHHCVADKFLIIHPFYSGSHVLTLHHVAKNLVDRGHKVVTVRFQDAHEFKLKPLGSNHKEILLFLNNSLGNLPFVSVEEEGKFGMPVEFLWKEGLALDSIFKLPKQPWSVVKAHCHTLLSNKSLISDLKSEQFDLSIVDLIYNECSLALASHDLDTPTVAYWAFSFSSGEAEFSTVATPPSHIPAFMSEYTDSMNLWQRTVNFAIKTFFARPFMYYHTWVTDGVIGQYYPDCPSSASLLSDLNGALINTNFVLDYPRLQPTTFINVGGMQIAHKPQPLPKDLQEFLDGSGPHGTILFTMGFIFQPNAVPDSRIQAFFDAFQRLPQRIIMKLDALPDTSSLKVPKNVMLKSFLPQQDILAHEKTILFITHCGMHGVMEAIYYRVPMVGMPVFIDQGDVLARMEQKGIGKGLGKWATSDEIYNAIVSVRDDPSYQKNIDHLSNLMKAGMKSTPMESAIWLLEFLAQTKGGQHLKLSSRHLNMVQYLSLDSIFLVSTVMYLVAKLICILLRKLLKKKNKTD